MNHFKNQRNEVKFYLITSYLTISNLFDLNENFVNFYKKTGRTISSSEYIENLLEFDLLRFRIDAALIFSSDENFFLHLIFSFIDPTDGRTEVN